MSRLARQENGPSGSAGTRLQLTFRWAATAAMLLVAVGCKNVPACPPGAKLMGQAPPEGQQVWCQKIVDGKPVKEGPFILYHPDGSKMLQGQYHNGKQTGEWTMWYTNGRIRSSDHYRDGVRDGEHISWYTNGQISTRGRYVNGKRDGVWKRWGPSGIRNWEEVYKNGRKISPQPKSLSSANHLAPPDRIRPCRPSRT